VLLTGSLWPAFAAETVAGNESPASIVQVNPRRLDLTFTDDFSASSFWIVSVDDAEITFDPPLLLPQSGTVGGT
jgi:hypothetical protein